LSLLIGILQEIYQTSINQILGATRLHYCTIALLTLLGRPELYWSCIIESPGILLVIFKCPNNCGECYIFVNGILNKRGQEDGL
jgi:hypothetical protein